MPTIRDLIGDYKELLDQTGGDRGTAFNITEDARAGRPNEFLASLPPDELVALNRFAQAADVPATAALAVPYEAMKGIEQNTGIPVLTKASEALNYMGVPVAMPSAHTSPASMTNILASIAGATSRLVPERRGSSIGSLLAMIGGR